MSNYHLAILKKQYLDATLDGRKTIESRFSRTRRYAFGRLLPDDKIFLKLSSGPVCAAATVLAVKNFTNLTQNKIAALKQQYNRYIVGSDEYWKSKANCRFGFLVWLKDVKPIEPVRISKKDWRGWVILTEKRKLRFNENKQLNLAENTP